jgi:hypothetical protein
MAQYKKKRAHKNPSCGRVYFRTFSLRSPEQTKKLHGKDIKGDTYLTRLVDIVDVEKIVCALDFHEEKERTRSFPFFVFKLMFYHAAYWFNFYHHSFCPLRINPRHIQLNFHQSILLNKIPLDHLCHRHSHSHFSRHDSFLNRNPYSVLF